MLSLFLLSNFSFTFLYAQTFEHQVCLKNVSFIEDNSTTPEEYIHIKQDQSGLVYEVPQYSQNKCDGTGRTTKNPVAYVSGSKVKVRMNFGQMCAEDILIRGIVNIANGNTSTQMIFPCCASSNEGNNNGEFNKYYTGTSDESFTLEKVRYFENFDIDWQWSHLDPADKDPCLNAEWISFGTSSNPIYVTHKKPTVAANVYRTTIHFGCTEAHNKSVESSIIAHIWEPFDENNFNPARFDGEIFTYWKKCNPVSCVDLPTLLAAPKAADARCGALAELLKAIMTTQGIGSFVTLSWESESAFGNDLMSDLNNEFDLSNINWDYTFGLESRFMAVKKWDFSSASNNFFKLGSWKCSPQWANGLLGIAGQGKVANPLSLHVNHANLKMGNTIYDPSYGYKEDATYIEYKNANLDSVNGRIITVQNKTTGVVNYYYWIGTKNDPLLLDLIVTEN